MTNIKPIAHIYTDFDSKFGIPRQSGLVEELTGKIVFEPEYRRTEAVRGLDGFSHIWLIWQFSQSVTDKFSPTVRPPRLGGNRRVGVFASRSPFRPNSLGLSCVKLIKIDIECDKAPVIYVSGVDMLNFTPIFDIKPYVPVADSKYDAKEGYTEITKNHSLNVVDGENLLSRLGAEKRASAVKVLSNDPRPGYDEDADKEYGMSFAGFNIRFQVDGETLNIKAVEPDKFTEDKRTEKR